MKLFRSARLLLLAFLICLVPASSFAGVFISISIAPPVLPVYVQPPCPTDGYMWTPGYWAYDDPDVGYYWVPGAWVPAPSPGLLWTPGYWGWNNGIYIFNRGYWGAHVGYYGGVNYGFGFMGIGFAGGEWRGGHFAYNTAVVNVNTTVIHNTYVNTTIVHNTTIVNNSHVAYSGGPGGIQHQPTAEEKVAMTEKHVPPTPVQQQHVAAAAKDPQQRFSANHGKPATVAAARPLTAPVHTQPAARPVSQSVNHPAAAAARPAARSTPQTEARPAAQSRPAPQTHAAPAPEARPAPQSRPAPQPHAAPAPRPKEEEKPRGR